MNEVTPPVPTVEIHVAMFADGNVAVNAKGGDVLGVFYAMGQAMRLVAEKAIQQKKGGTGLLVATPQFVLPN